MCFVGGWGAQSDSQLWRTLRRCSRYCQGAQNASKDQELELRQLLSEVEDVDIAQAVLEFKSVELAYQAALLAVSQVAQLPTLFEVAYR